MPYGTPVEHTSESVWRVSFSDANGNFLFVGEARLEPSGNESQTDSAFQELRDALANTSLVGSVTKVTPYYSEVTETP